MIVKKYFLWIPFSNSYILKEINSLKIIPSMKSLTSWGNNGIYKYDMDTNVVNFQYKSNNVFLGKGIKDFDGKLVSDEIKKRI